MLSRCIVLAVLGCAFAVPIAVPQQYQTHQHQPEGVPPHLLRQYLGDQGPAAGAQTQALPRPAHIPGAVQAPARLPYSAQSAAHFQPQQQQQQQQQQYQPQPQPQQHFQAQQQQQQYQANPQYNQQYEQPQQSQREKEDYDPNPSYQFGFDVNDDQYTNYQNRKEQREGNVIKGSYSVVDSDGFIRTVTYTADPKEGFKAEVNRQPTDIVVKIPTPKPQIQQHQVAPQQRPQQPPSDYYRYEQ